MKIEKRTPFLAINSYESANCVAFSVQRVECALGANCTHFVILLPTFLVF